MALLEFNLLRSDYAARSLEDSCVLNGVLFEADELKKAFEELQSKLSELEDARLIELAIQAQHLEWCSFILRGMCASELRRRYTLRLPGGRGRRDRAGKGIQAQMCRLADALGVSPTTLTTDARISDMFFSPARDTTIARECTLPREYYVIALSAPDPHEAIRIAIQYIHNGGCSRDQFRAYVHSLKQSPQPHAQTKNKTRNLIRLYVTCEVRTALIEIAQLTGRSEAEEVAAMILAERKALSQRDKKMGQEEVHNTKTVKAKNPSQMMLIK